MITENEIRNQIAITETLQNFTKLSHTKTIVNRTYIHALKYVLGEAKAKYDKEDI